MVNTVTPPREVVQQALRGAYSLGQTYWRQADSESFSQHAKADKTAAAFEQLIIDTCAALDAPAKPVDMVLYCPKCGLQHIDAPDSRSPDWTNPPHKSHLCHGCQHVWKPSDTPTNGVKQTVSGKDSDTAPVKPVDCRGCLHIDRYGYGDGCSARGTCTDFDKFQALPPVVLTKVTK